MKVGVHKVAMAAPSDTSELADLIDSGVVNPRDIVAVIGKTEGNGGANDFTRALATLSFAHLLAPHLGMTQEAVMDEIAFVWSGGTEGVLSPHATIFTRSRMGTGVTSEPRLALGIAMTREIAPEEFGTPTHVGLVAQAVTEALSDAGITDAGDVHYVQVKGPLLTPAVISRAQAQELSLVTEDPNGSKAFARGAMALGVAVGLGEVAAEAVTASTIARDLSLYSGVASTSAGGELIKCEVLLFGNSPTAVSDFRIGHAVLRDALDAQAVAAAAASAGADIEDVVAIFAKAEATTTLRGRRTTMYSDADINYERHARAAVGAVIASVTGDPAIFLSGGTEHQCRPGEAPIAAIVRR